MKKRLAREAGLSGAKRPWDRDFVEGNPMQLERLLMTVLFAAVGCGAVGAIAIAISLR